MGWFFSFKLHERVVDVTLRHISGMHRTHVKSQRVFMLFMKKTYYLLQIVTRVF